jgi:protein-S-isoprenylcysteine O-methyltransferase Ste14
MTRLPALGARGEGWVVVQGVILVLIALAGSAGPAWSGGWRIAGAVAGLTALLLGAMLAARGIVDLRDALTPFPHPRPGAPLVEHGAYRLVRHPIYGGLILGAFGWGLVTASPAALGLAAVLLAFFDLKSRREEAWLTDHFAGYAAYRHRTRRLIPFVY